MLYLHSEIEISQKLEFAKKLLNMCVNNLSEPIHAIFMRNLILFHFQNWTELWEKLLSLRTRMCKKSRNVFCGFVRRIVCQCDLGTYLLLNNPFRPSYWKLFVDNSQ